MAEERDLIHIGNLTVDAETGEIVKRPAGFVIDTPAALSWWLGKMRQLRALADSEEALARRAAARAQVLRKAADALEAHYADEARPMVAALLPKGRRSILLDGGEAGFRMTPGSINITNPEAAIAWCKDHLPAAVKVVESLLKTPISDALKATGTLPPGVEQVPAGDKLWVR